MSTERALPRPLTDAARPGAAAALAGAATVHATVIGEHYAEWALAGAFFLALLVTETFLGLWLWRWPSRHAARAVAVTGVLTVAVWAVSRTSGLPFGPADFRVPEAVGAPDVACVVLEQLAAILALLATDRHTRPRATRERPAAVGHATRLGVLGVVLAVTALGLGPTLAGHPHEHQHHGDPAPSAHSGD
jgi:MFS family permease